jgi:hypothetical protein
LAAPANIFFIRRIIKGGFFVEHSEVFKQILETEQLAKTQRYEAERRQAGLDKYLAEKEAALRKDSYANADAEIAREEERFRATIDKEIEKLKLKQERTLSNIDMSFKKKLDEWVVTLFETVLGDI